MTTQASGAPFMPVDQPGPAFVDFFGLLRGNAARTPDKVAAIVGAQRIDWATFVARVEETAAQLTTLGFAPGERLAVLSEPSVAFLVAFAAALACGGCLVPLPAIVSDTALGGVLRDCGARIVLVSGAMAGRIPALDITDFQAYGLDGAAADWADLAEVAPAAAWQAPDVAPGQLFNIIYSSGTTGTPKGIVHDQLYRFRQLQRMRALGLDEASVTLLATATYSNTTLTPAIAALGNGGTLVMMPKFLAEDYLATARAERPTHTMIVPIQIQRVLESPTFDPAALASLRSTIVTSSPWPLAIKKKAIAQWPGDLLEMYGMTEGGLTTVLNTKSFPDKLATVGRPSALADVRVVGADGGTLPAGETGEIVGRSPTMMQGYYGRPDLTEQAVLRLPDGKVFFRSGDLGHFDADGFLTLSGRSKDVIISGGFNIYAVDLEEALLAHPQINEAAVIGVPDAKWGETPVAFVVTAPGADAEALRAEVNAGLGRVQRISAVGIVDTLPRNALGKVQKNLLRDTWMQDRKEG